MAVAGQLRYAILQEKEEDRACVVGWKKFACSAGPERRQFQYQDSTDGIISNCCGGLYTNKFYNLGEIDKFPLKTYLAKQYRRKDRKFK